MDPAFIDLKEEGSSLCGRRKGNPIICSKAEIKRQRKRKGEASSSYLVKESAHKDQNEPWVDKYSPRLQVSITAVSICFCIHELCPVTGLLSKWLLY